MWEFPYSPHLPAVPYDCHITPTKCSDWTLLGFFPPFSLSSHLCGMTYSICLYICLILLKMMPSGPMHLAENGRISFFFMMKYYSIPFSLSIKSIVFAYCEQWFNQHGGAGIPWIPLYLRVWKLWNTDSWSFKRVASIYVHFLL